MLLLTAFISSIPAELDEAAWMDGSGYLRYLIRVVVPLTRPALLIAFLYALLGVWNDIIGPVVFLANPACSRSPGACTTSSAPTRASGRCWRPAS